MSQVFLIHKEEQALIEAAIRLGDWVSAQEGITNEQIEGVKQLQEALRRLPEVTDGLCAEYGFSATDVSVEEWDGLEPVPEGTERCWNVMYSQARELDGSIVSVLEIFSIFHPFPLRYYEEFAGDEMELTVYKRSFQKNSDSDIQADQLTDWHIGRIRDWVSSVNAPDLYRKDNVRFEVEADTWIPKWLPSDNENT